MIHSKFLILTKNALSKYTRIVIKIHYRISFRELSLSLLFLRLEIFRGSLCVMVVIPTSRLALQKLGAILAKYIATAGRLIGEARLLKWFCEQKNISFFRSISWRLDDSFTAPQIAN